MSCLHGTEGLAAELRSLATVVLDRVEPLLEAARSGEPAPSSCSSCPVCAVQALLRGERPELAGNLAEHASALVGALRTLLEETSEQEPPASRVPVVQHIPVVRA